MAGHKAGFVNIIGKPNSGKSTLMNVLINERLSIITSKAQTTRHRILGILSNDNYQIVFSDTPGVVQPHYKLHESMMKAVNSAIEDADIILLLTEANNDFDNEIIINKIKKAKIQVIVLINKIDLSTQQEVNIKISQWQKLFTHSEVIPVSALNSFNTDKVLSSILEKLPESPPYYNKDELTDKPLRFFISEIIREKILLLYRKEVPYSIEVKVDEFKERENIIMIKAFIYVSRESQKIIIIGHKGKAIKKLGIESRKDIEKFVNKKVYLELSVKITKDWRNDPKQLRRFGYEY